jgi:methyl-accepting chemotaxis protein
LKIYSRQQSDAPLPINWSEIATYSREIAADIQEIAVNIGEIRIYTRRTAARSRGMAARSRVSTTTPARSRFYAYSLQK